MRFPKHGRGSITFLTAFLFAGCGGSATAPTPVPTPGPSGRFLFAADPGAATISSYSVDAANGQITSRGEAGLSGGSRTLSLAVDPMGRFLFVSRVGGGIDVFKINRTDGTLALATGSPFDTLRQAEALSLHPNGRFLLATRAFNFAIETFALDATSGALALQSSASTAGFTPTTPVLTADGRFIFLGSGTVAKVVIGLVDATTGKVTLRASYDTPDSVRSLSVDPAGSYLYVTTATPFSSDTLFIYRIDSPTGLLGRVNGPTFAAGFDPVASNFRPDTVTFDPLGHFAYVLDRAGRTGAHSRGVFVFPVQTSGLLGPSVLGPFTTPAANASVTGDPVAFVLDPSGHFAYLADATTRTISAFVVDPATGGLTPSGTPRAAAPGSAILAVTP